MKPIYEPKGRAKEYGELACNIYTECNHGCSYCYARTMAARFGRPWTGEVKARNGITDAVKQQLDKERITGKHIHLCFTCDPYPAEIDTTPTREIIKAIKKSGNHVQILTKGGKRAERDFDLLDSRDWFGVTYTGIGLGMLFGQNPAEPNAAPYSERLASLGRAKKLGIKTWMSCEPVLREHDVLNMIRLGDYIDLYKIGKLNYGKSNINWREFGFECERLCKKYERNYYIKENLRESMV